MIADLSTVWVDFSVYRRDIKRVSVGDTVMIDPEDGGTRDRSQDFLRLAGRQQRHPKRARARGRNNDDLRLRPGLFVTGRLLLCRRSRWMSPSSPSALQTLENRTVVFVRVGEKFEPRDVELGERDPEHVEVMFGLIEGDVYAAKNSFIIKAEIAKGTATHEH